MKSGIKDARASASVDESESFGESASKAKQPKPGLF